MDGPSKYRENPTKRAPEEVQGVLKPGDKTPEDKRAEEISRRELIRRGLSALRDVTVYGVSRKIFGTGNGQSEKQVSNSTQADSGVKIEPLGKQKP